MAEYTGTSMYISFTAGTVVSVLSADYRTISTAPVIGLADASAGNDADKTYLPTLKDGKYSWKGLAQTAGTVLENALLEGTLGTLIIAREGTASGKPKETCPVIAMGATFNFPYDNVVEISCEFQKNGARVLATY
jgi:hypothetical protein